MRVPRRSGTDDRERSRDAADTVVPEGPGLNSCGRTCGFVGNIYGKQVKDRDGQTASEVLDPQGAALHALWSPSGCLSQVRALPDLLPEARRSGKYPRCKEGKLVTTGLYRGCPMWRRRFVGRGRQKDSLAGFTVPKGFSRHDDRSHRRHAHSHSQRGAR